MYNREEIDQIANDLVLGTCISGTYRNQDLIPAFLSLLVLVDDVTYTGYMVAPFGPVPSYALEDDKAPWWDSEDAVYLLERLFDDLNAAAPPGYYFGSHEGNGSAFGYWAIDCVEEVS